MHDCMDMRHHDHIGCRIDKAQAALFRLDLSIFQASEQSEQNV